MPYSLQTAGVPVYRKIERFADTVFRRAADFLGDEFHNYRDVVDLLSYGVFRSVFAGELEPLSEASGLQALIGLLNERREFQRTVKRFQFHADTIVSSETVILEFADWFLAAAAEVFRGIVAEDGSSVQREDLPGKWLRHPALFHLNLTGVELLNRLDREGFRQTARKAVFVPECLSSPDEEGCLAGMGALGRFCIGCSRGCPVAALYLDCTAGNTEVVLVKHTDQPFAEGTALELISGGYGVVGIACASALLENSWGAFIEDLPVQYLPLNNPACCHWFDHRRDTSVDRDELFRILGIKN